MIYGDGSQTRSFCYVDDLIDGAIRFMNSEEVFLESVNLPQDDPVHRKPIITAAEEKLGWKPQIMLKEGLSRTIEYFLKNDK